MNYQEAFTAALRLLVVRDRSKAEITQRLSRRGAEPEVCEQVVLRLSELGYLDDAGFARGWIEDRIEHRPMGRFRLRHELQEKGVSKDVAEEAIENLVSGNEEELCLQAARKRLLALKGLPPEVRQRRLAGFLQRRGFPENLIRGVLRQVMPGDDEEEWK